MFVPQYCVAYKMTLDSVMRWAACLPLLYRSWNLRRIFVWNFLAVSLYRHCPRFLDAHVSMTSAFCRWEESISFSHTDCLWKVKRILHIHHKEWHSGIQKRRVKRNFWQNNTTSRLSLLNAIINVMCYLYMNYYRRKSNQIY